MGSIEDIRKNWHSYNAQDVKWMFSFAFSSTMATYFKSQKYSFAKINLVKVYQFKKIKNKNDLQTNLMQKLKENLRTFKEILDFEDIKRQGGMSSEFSDYFREISKMKEN